MAEPEAAVRWTVEMVDALPYDEWHRYEIVDGELFVSTPPGMEHQLACNYTAVALTNWNDDIGLGEVIPGLSIVFTRQDSVIPDLMWASHERLGRILGDDHRFHGAPELVIEVLSPGSANERRDRQVKLALYSRQGVEEFWLLDWRVRTVTVYRQQAGGLAFIAALGHGNTLTSPLLPGFRVTVARLFGRG